MARDSHKLHFFNRSDPSSGFLIIILLLFATSLVGGRPDRSVEQIVAFLASFIIATTIHEFCHAYFAYKLGDTTARDLGRITLNPLAHFELFGFLGMVMISLGFGFIGWGKPVPVNPNRFTHKTLRAQRGMALVAIAGPISNLVQAAAVAIPLRLAGVEFTLRDGTSGMFGWTFVYVNLLLAAFNMIPIPPLDGSKVLLGIVPRFWYQILAPLERYGFLILFLLFFIGGQFSSPLVSAMIDPPFHLFTRWIIGRDLFY